MWPKCRFAPKMTPPADVWAEIYSVLYLSTAIPFNEVVGNGLPDNPAANEILFGCPDMYISNREGDSSAMRPSGVTEMDGPRGLESKPTPAPVATQFPLELKASMKCAEGDHVRRRSLGAATIPATF